MLLQDIPLSHTQNVTLTSPGAILFRLSQMRPYKYCYQAKTVHQFSPAAIKNYYKLGGLKHQKCISLLSHHSRGLEVQNQGFDRAVLSNISRGGSLLSVVASNPCHSLTFRCITPISVALGILLVCLYSNFTHLLGQQLLEQGPP